MKGPGKARVETAPPVEIIHTGKQAFTLSNSVRTQLSVGEEALSVKAKLEAQLSGDSRQTPRLDRSVFEVEVQGLGERVESGLFDGRGFGSLLAGLP
jgi:hypothetical protein